jgi:HSP20 family protein
MASLLPSLRRNPTQSEKPLARLRDELDTLFERLLSPWSESSESEYGLDRLGNLEVDDRDSEIVVRAETPGFDPKEIDVEVNGRLLTIKAEKKQEKKRNKKGDGDIEEQEYRAFVESVALPEGVERDKIEAKYHHGVLEVHLPKSEKAKPKRISVQS